MWNVFAAYTLRQFITATSRHFHALSFSADGGCEYPLFLGGLRRHLTLTGSLFVGESGVRRHLSHPDVASVSVILRLNLVYTKVQAF